jgi:hypothetical protein
LTKAGVLQHDAIAVQFRLTSNDRFLTALLYSSWDFEDRSRLVELRKKGLRWFCANLPRFANCCQAPNVYSNGRRGIFTFPN